MSIKAVFIGTVVGLQIATVAAILVSTMVTSRDALLGHGRQLVEAAANDVLERSQSFLRPAEDAVALTQRLAAAELQKQGDPRGLERYFLETLRLHPQFAGMYYGGSDGSFFYVNRSAEKSPDGMRTKSVSLPDGRRRVDLRWRDAAGRVVAEERDPSDSYDPRQRPWFRKAAAEGGMVWNDPYVFFTSRQPGVTVSMPVKDAVGDIAGVVGVDIEIADISAFLAALRRDTGSTAVILGHNGEVVAHPDAAQLRAFAARASRTLPKLEGLDDPLTRSLVAELARPDRGSMFRVASVDGNEYLAALVTVPQSSLPWRIAVHAPASLYLGSLTANQRSNMLIALAVAMLAIAAGLAVARAVARPIAQLRTDAVAVSQGRFPAGARPPTTRFADVQQAITAFHQMLDGLRRAQAELEAANQALEARVAERTSALRQEVAERELIAEHLRIAKDQADEANRAKSRFLSSMSHELRTPLNAILGFAQLLKIDAETLGEEQREWVDHIVASGQHLLDMISQVLDFAKIEAGGFGLSIEEVGAEQVIDECLILSRMQAVKRGIDLTVEPVPPNLPPLRADFTRLKQALLNLLSNAIKFNRDGGSVVVRVAQRGDRIRIEVADTGCGICETERDMLFEPFSRLTATRDLVDGTGIGLAITKHLVTLMQGRIGFSSAPGQGSTFWLELPAAVRRDQPRPLPGEITVLYIEDNPSNVKLMEQVLHRFGRCHMLQAATAEIGLEMVRRHRPDLVIMDINLPGMDGYAALAEIRSHPETRDMPVIALTANALPADRDKALSSGFDAYVAKPLDVREMLSAMSDMLAA